MGLSKFLPMMQPANMGGGGDLGLFNDAHGFLQGVSAEVGVLKRQISQNDETRRAEIEELRKELEQERFERRDALNKLRYEFEEFVHRKIDKVIEEVEEMKCVERRDDSQQQTQINHLIENVDRLKENLFGIQTAWGKLVTQCIKPLESASFGGTTGLGGANERPESKPAGGDANDPDRARRVQVADSVRRGGSSSVKSRPLVTN